jgi:hypothetical protein
MVTNDAQPVPVNPRSTVTLELRLLRLMVVALQLEPAVADN